MLKKTLETQQNHTQQIVLIFLNALSLKVIEQKHM